jgi:ABC-2 type transport system ATP-binding protein
MRSNDASIEVRGLSHGYGERMVLDGIDLSLQSGEFFGLLGQNGAGKSTLIRALCGFWSPASGEIRVAGVDVVRNPMAVRSRIGVVSEEAALYDRLTGAEFLEFAGQMHGLSAMQSRERTRDLLERLDLTEAADRRIGEYSLGMHKKTAFAAALIHAPRVLFLDEPFNGVDAASTRTLCALLKNLCVERGVTVLFTSHVLDMAERLCDRVAILHAGAIRREGAIVDLKAEAAQHNASLEEVFLQLTDARSPVGAAPAWYV